VHREVRVGRLNLAVDGGLHAAMKYTIHLSSAATITYPYTYTVSHKKCHFVFNYNLGVSWLIFILFIPVETVIIKNKVARFYFLWLAV